MNINITPELASRILGSLEDTVENAIQEHERIARDAKEGHYDPEDVEHARKYIDTARETLQAFQALVK